MLAKFVYSLNIANSGNTNSQQTGMIISGSRNVDLSESDLEMLDMSKYCRVITNTIAQLIVALLKAGRAHGISGVYYR